MQYVIGAILLIASFVYLAIKVIVAAIVAVIYAVLIACWVLIIGMAGLFIYAALRLSSRSSR